MLYIYIFLFWGNICLSLFNTPIVVEHLFEVISECFLHFKFVSRVRPRKLNSLTFVMFVLLIWSPPSVTLIIFPSFRLIFESCIYVNY